MSRLKSPTTTNGAKTYLARIINKGRLASGLSMTALADELGVSCAYVSDVEKSRRGISKALSDKIATVLFIDPAELTLAIGLYRGKFDLAAATPHASMKNELAGLLVARWNEMTEDEAEKILELLPQ